MKKASFRKKLMVFCVICLTIVAIAWFINASAKNSADKGSETNSESVTDDSTDDEKIADDDSQNTQDTQATDTSDNSQGENDSNATIQQKVTLYLFWGEGCPYCMKEKSFLSDLRKDMPEIEIKEFEVYNNSSNYQKFLDMAKAYNTEVEGVPMTFIGDKYWRGYADPIGDEIEQYLQGCLNTQSCSDPGDRLAK